jgi:hypothetical protein
MADSTLARTIWADTGTRNRAIEDTLIAFVELGGIDANLAAFRAINAIYAILIEFGENVGRGSGSGGGGGRTVALAVASGRRAVARLTVPVI